MKTVNLTRFRTDHLLGVYEKARAQVDQLHTHQFLLFSEGRVNRRVLVWGLNEPLDYGVVAVSFQTAKLDKVKPTALSVLASCRALPDGTFGQLCHSLVAWLRDPSVASSCKSSIPRWARGIPLLERERNAQPSWVSRFIFQGRDLFEPVRGLLRDDVLHYLQEEDVTPLLDFAEHRARVAHARRQKELDDRILSIQREVAENGAALRKSERAAHWLRAYAAKKAGG